MRKHLLLAALLTVAAAPASQAQSGDTGVRTETQERLTAGRDRNTVWNIIGLFGLVGLIGLRKRHAEDSYHPSSLD